MPSYDEVQAECAALRLGSEAGELHGGLVGWLSGGGAGGAGWLRDVLVDDTLPLVAEGGVLDALHAATRAQLEDRDFAFEMVLPEDSAPLQERVAALFGWCRGFVGAFGLAAGAEPSISEEGREALEDLVRLAAANPDEGGEEEDESALVEIQEFVRVAALLLHGDCVMGRRHRARLN